APVEGVLEDAGNRAGVLGGHDDDAVDRGDRVLELARDGGEVGVVVRAVNGQLGQVDVDQFDTLGGEGGEVARHGAVDGLARDRADDDANAHGYVSLKRKACESTCADCRVNN